MSSFPGRETTFLAVRCFNCRMCQVIQANKKKRFCCKICSSQQTIQRVVHHSTSAAELRHVVQALNASLGEKTPLPSAPELPRTMPDCFHGNSDVPATVNESPDETSQLCNDDVDFYRPCDFAWDLQGGPSCSSSSSYQEIGETHPEGVAECGWSSRRQEEPQFSPGVPAHVPVRESALPARSDWNDESVSDGWQGREDSFSTAVRQKQHGAPPSKQEDTSNGARRSRWNSSKGLWTERHSRAMT